MIGRPFQKGQSGNPSGRPKAAFRLLELAQEHAQTAIDTLVSVMNDTNSTASARVTAANALLDRGFGRPLSSVEVQTPEKDPSKMRDAELIAAITEGVADDPELLEIVMAYGKKKVEAFENQSLETKQ